MRNLPAIVILLLVCSCDSVKNSENSSRVTVAFRSLVSSLDPLRENSVISNSIYCNIFETLVQRDASMKIVPALAISWSNPDDRTYILKLRSNVHFHNGGLMAPEDVRASLERARSDPASQLSSSLSMLEKVEVEGSDTIRIVTRKPYSILLNRLAETWILPAKLVSQGGYSSENPPGTGPYKVKEWKSGQFLLLERNNSYWGEKPPVFQIAYHAIPDLQQRIQGLVQGKIDILPHLEPSALDSHAMQDHQKVRIQSVPGLMVLHLAMDLWREKTPYADPNVNPFRDIRVRKAIYHAINIKRIIQDVLKGDATPATQLATSKELGYNDRIKRLPYDPETARQLLKEANYPNGFRVRLDITNNRYQNDVEIGRAIVQDLAAVGIHVDLNAVDKDTLFRMRVLRATSFYMIGWMDGSADAGSAFDTLIHTQDSTRAYGIANAGGYSNPEVDRLIERSSEELVPHDRIILLEKAMQLTMEDVPVIPLHVENDLTASSIRIDLTPRSDQMLFANSIRIH